MQIIQQQTASSTVTGELVMGKQIISITEKKQLLSLLCNSMISS